MHAEYFEFFLLDAVYLTAYLYVMEIKELLSRFPQGGRVLAISIRPERLAEPVPLKEVWAEKGIGLQGDHYQHPNGMRQVTLIQKEHLDAVAAFLKRDINYTLTRRNILVSELNLLALKGKQFQIGKAIFEFTGECHPCSRMEVNLGFGGYNAMRNHGGITAKVIESGMIEIGSAIGPLM